MTVEIVGRRLTTTFWGDAWCRNLEAYSDYANRLPRGRAYVRHGLVIDLKIEAGRVRSLVSGSDIYEVDIRIEPLSKPRWAAIKPQSRGCAPARSTRWWSCCRDPYRGA